MWTGPQKLKKSGKIANEQIFIAFTYLFKDFILLWNAKCQFRVENTEFKIQNLRYIGLLSQSIVFKTGGL